MGTIRFEIRTEKTGLDGKAPVRLIYQVKGQRKYFNIGIRVYGYCWDTDSQRAVYLSPKAAKKLQPPIGPGLLLTEAEVKDINRDLERIKLDIGDIEKVFKGSKITYSSQMVIDRLRETIHPETKKEVPTNVLSDFIDKYIEEHSDSRKPGSMQVYKSMKKHLQNYERETGHRITFDKVDDNFFQGFQNYLINLTAVDNNGVRYFVLRNTTIAKQLSTIKTFLTYARKRDIQVSDKYRDFKIKRDAKKVIPLTEEEFQTLLAMDLRSNKRLDQVRDIFCFSCATGLRYSDLAQLRWEHIKGEEIILNITKTQDDLTIPLNKYSSGILAKYAEMARPLPMISNQKLNDYIKELCNHAGIDDPIEIVTFRGAKREATIYPKHRLISIHTGRRTFCTLSLEKGMSAEEVMSITGHKDYHSFKRYVKITEKRKAVVMGNTWGKTDKLILRFNVKP